jgi:hypothetical protein
MCRGAPCTRERAPSATPFTVSGGAATEYVDDAPSEGVDDPFVVQLEERLEGCPGVARMSGSMVPFSSCSCP